MISTTQIPDERMARYLRAGRRLHGEAVFAAVRQVGRAMARSVATLFSLVDADHRKPA